MPTPTDPDPRRPFDAAVPLGVPDVVPPEWCEAHEAGARAQVRGSYLADRAAPRWRPWTLVDAEPGTRLLAAGMLLAAQACIGLTVLWALLASRYGDVWWFLAAVGVALTAAVIVAGRLAPPLRAQRLAHAARCRRTRRRGRALRRARRALG